jgi:hypothetical protein
VGINHITSIQDWTRIILRNSDISPEIDAFKSGDPVQGYKIVHSNYHHHHHHHHLLYAVYLHLYTWNKPCL